MADSIVDDDKCHHSKQLKREKNTSHNTPQVWFMLPGIQLLAPLLHSCWRGMRTPKMARTTNPESSMCGSDGDQDG